MIYLASPYSSSDPAKEELNYQEALKATVYLIKNGHVVFSPIVYSHKLHLMTSRTIQHNYWLDIDLSILPVCDTLVILTLEGWESSKGIKKELGAAYYLNKPIRKMELIKPYDSTYRTATINTEEIKNLLGEELKCPGMITNRTLE